MTRRIIILLLCLFSLDGSASAQEGGTGKDILGEIARFGQADVIIANPGRPEIDIISSVLSVRSVREKYVVISLSPSTAGWFISRGYRYELIRRTETKDNLSAASLREALSWQSYPTYSDYLLMMQNFASLYPALCRLETIGTSVEGKLVQVLKISDNVNVDEDEPEVFYTSTMHGDETGGFVMLLRFADSLLSGYSGSQRIKNLVNSLQIWINPLSNPDGAYVLDNNQISSTWSTRYNANGIDLNRNFPDPDQPLKVYEKETSDMVKFLRKRRFSISANFHSGAEVLNYPWDKWLSRIHADDAWFQKICRAYADTVHTVSPAAYLNDFDRGVVRGAVWYTVSGGRQDFVTRELQGREVTMEIDYYYVTPPAQLELLWIYNRKSLIGYLENALYGIHGRVFEEGTSIPCPARIFISGYDKDSSHVYADTLTGRFIRMLTPGTWNLTFTARGFRDTTVTGVIVSDKQKTDLTVYMKPVATRIDSTHPDIPVVYPNPSSGQISCMLPGDITGNVEVMLIDNSGRMALALTINIIPGGMVNMDLSRLGPGSYIIRFIHQSTGKTLYSRVIVSGR